MPTAARTISFPKFRSKHLYFKYYDNIVKHPDHFEFNLIGLGYPACCHAERSPKYLGRQFGQISPDKNVLARRSASARRRELSLHNRSIYHFS